MESKKISQLATELTPDLSDLTIIGDPTTGISKKITLSQMASLFTGTVEEYANLAAFPLVGVADTIYIALDTNILYRWNTGTSAYVELSPNIVSSLVFNDANGFDGTINLVGSVATLTITTALTTGSVGFIGASGALLQDNANFFWDDTNNRLGLGTNAPTTALDVFGSGIIGRLNGTSTNNAFLGFSSAGTNKWSIGNVQSDHRFRIYNEATTSELVSVLSTGEFGIGIANPTTKFHIDGAASALIANLDANVSVAKSVSYRSDNSARINLEVSGTESGSNAGADFFLRTFTDAGSLLETPFTIVRSTGVTTIKSLTLTNVLSVANGGTGSATQNFVDLTTTQSIGGAKTFTSALAGTSATFSGELSVTSGLLSISGSGATPPTSGVGLRFASNRLIIYGGSSDITFQKNSNASANMTILESGNVGIGVSSPTNIFEILKAQAATTTFIIENSNDLANAATEIRLVGNVGTAPLKNNLQVSFVRGSGGVDWAIGQPANSDDFVIAGGTNQGDGKPSLGTSERFRISSNGNIFMGKSAEDASVAGFQYRGAVPGLVQITRSAGEPLQLWRSTSVGQMLVFFYNGSEVGSISYNGTNTILNPTSDKRLKENIVDSGSGLAKLSKVKIRAYDWKQSGMHTDFGIVAQEIYEAAPECVSVGSDELDENGNLKNPWCAQPYVLVSAAVKAIQELNQILQEQQIQIQNLQEQIDELKTLINK